MTDDANLERNARELLRSGRLPRHRPNRLWGGFASGRERCVVCGEPISPGQVALEAEFRDGAATASHDFHVGCLSALESQWKRLEEEPESALSSRSEPHDQAKTGS
jgi:hypothetical protein